MKNQNTTMILQKQFPSGFGFAATIFTLVLATAAGVFGQLPRSISVKVGEVKNLKVERQISEANVRVDKPAVARALFSKNSKQIEIRGLSAGTVRLVFSGTSPRGAGITGALTPAAFSETIDITVVAGNGPEPTTEPADPNIFRAQLNRGQTRDFRIDTILGPEFAKASDNGVRWRNIRLTGDRNLVVRGDLVDNDQLKVRVFGVKTGTGTLTLEGELRRNGAWETITRTVEVAVAAEAGAAAEPADPWLQAMARRLTALKTAARQAGVDEAKLKLSIGDYSGFVTLVDAEIAKERRSSNPRQLREARLENVRNEAAKDLQRLREQYGNVVKQPVLIGWHDTLRDTNIVLGNKPTRRTFFCPPNPQKSFGTVYGTNWYLINSSLCTAALHAGEINVGGGNITAEFHDGRKGDKFIGSKRNGVASQSWERSWGSFIFVR